jgi:hypothetical protein
MSKPPGVSGTIGNDADRCIPPAIRRLYKHQSGFFFLSQKSLFFAQSKINMKINYLGFDAKDAPAVGCIN